MADFMKLGGPLKPYEGPVYNSKVGKCGVGQGVRLRGPKKAVVTITSKSKGQGSYTMRPMVQSLY